MGRREFTSCTHTGTPSRPRPPATTAPDTRSPPRPSGRHSRWPTRAPGSTRMPATRWGSWRSIGCRPASRCGVAAAATTSRVGELATVSESPPYAPRSTSITAAARTGYRPCGNGCSRPGGRPHELADGAGAVLLQCCRPGCLEPRQCPGRPDRSCRHSQVTSSWLIRRSKPVVAGPQPCRKLQYTYSESRWNSEVLIVLTSAAPHRLSPDSVGFSAQPFRCPVAFDRSHLLPAHRDRALSAACKSTGGHPCAAVRPRLQLLRASREPLR